MIRTSEWHRHCTNTCCVWCTRCGLVTRICTATRMTSSPITLPCPQHREYDQHSQWSELQMLGDWWGTRGCWDLQKHVNLPAYIEVTVPDPMTKSLRA
jgi:hypothetical protein